MVCRKNDYNLIFCSACSLHTWKNDLLIEFYAGSRNQDQGSLKQKHGGLNINAKHMQHVVQGLPHARGLAHNLLNHKPHPIHFPLERRLQGRVVLVPTPRFDF